MCELKKLMGVIVLSLIMLCSVFPAFAATQSSTQPVQVTIGPTVSIAAFWANGANNSTITSR